MATRNPTDRHTAKKPAADESPVGDPVLVPAGSAHEEGVDPDLAAWRDELAFFKGARDAFMKDPRYAGKFVAISKQQVIDCDADDFRLAARIHGKHPDEVILIAKVADAEEVLELPSPELPR